MFYDNNGTPAILYSKGIKEALQRIFYITTVVGLTIPIILTSDGIDNFLVNYINTNASENIIQEVDNSDIESSITDEIPEYEYVDDIEQIKKYIMESNGLSEFDKNNIYNEEYLKFLFSIIDEQTRLYDLGERTKDINVVIFPNDSDETYSNAAGYYQDDTNTIHLKEYLNEDLKLYADTEVHEYIHLTQLSCKYRYIREALAEMLSCEFYGCEINSYFAPIRNVKKLIEVIGPDAVLNAAFNHDTTKFENAVKEYLDDEEAELLFGFLDSTAMYNDNHDVMDRGIEATIDPMIRKKVNNDQNQIDLINEAASNRNKFYFNSNHENYYTKVSLDICIDEKITSTVPEYLKSKGQPNSIEIYEINFNKNQFITNLSEIKDYIHKYKIGPILADEIKEYNEDQDYEKYIDNNNDNNIGYSMPQVGDVDLYIDVDENNNFVCNDMIVTDEKLISILNEYNDLKCTIYNYLSFSWDEYQNELPKFIYDKQYTAHVYYLDSPEVSIDHDTANNIVIDTIELPPISEEFDIEYLNKTKSK